MLILSEPHYGDVPDEKRPTAETRLDAAEYFLEVRGITAAQFVPLPVDQPGHTFYIANEPPAVPHSAFMRGHTSAAIPLIAETVALPPAETGGVL